MLKKIVSIMLCALFAISALAGCGKKADTSKAIYNIFSQTVRKLGAESMEKLLDVLDEIFSKVPIWDMGCNISDEAVLTSYNAMKPEK